jgi:hypothetical protein
MKLGFGQHRFGNGAFLFPLAASLSLTSYFMHLS